MASSRQDSPHDLAILVIQPVMPPTLVTGELSMVDSEQVQNGG
ncbi:MAG: hypothetical protein ABGZ37_02475 [Akkermansiaceae bacterium]|jgi:hypothetical protein